MTTDLLGGVYEMLFHNSSVMLPHARAGSARILGITSADRSPTLPDVPTVAEGPKWIDKHTKCILRKGKKGATP